MGFALSSEFGADFKASYTTMFCAAAAEGKQNKRGQNTERDRLSTTRPSERVAAWCVDLVFRARDHEQNVGRCLSQLRELLDGFVDVSLAEGGGGGGHDERERRREKRQRTIGEGGTRQRGHVGNSGTQAAAAIVSDRIEGAISVASACNRGVGLTIWRRSLARIFLHHPQLCRCSGATSGVSIPHR